MLTAHTPHLGSWDCRLPPPFLNLSARWLNLRSCGRYMWNPLSWAMEIAMVVSIALLDYADFVLILALLIANAVIR